MEAPSLAGVTKHAARQGQTILFTDESGLSERPHRCRTWSPRGETPVLQYHFRWHMLSAIAGITVWRFYLRLFPGTIRSPQVVTFLHQLLRHVPGKLLIIWDGLPVHRSRVVREFVEAQDGRITLERLPASPPALNPVEFIWGHWKHHELPNLCAKDFGELSGHARRALRRMRLRTPLVEAFWHQAGLVD